MEVVMRMFLEDGGASMSDIDWANSPTRALDELTDDCHAEVYDEHLQVCNRYTMRFCVINSVCIWSSKSV
jgi:hypothetical protein